jgi:hypothetical protein
MQFKSALPMPVHPRTIASANTGEQVDESKLEWAIALTELALLALCTARMRSDRLEGASVEGAIATALTVLLMTVLVAKAIAWSAQPVSVERATRARSRQMGQRERRP